MHRFVIKNIHMVPPVTHTTLVKTNVETFGGRQMCSTSECDSAVESIADIGVYLSRVIQLCHQDLSQANRPRLRGPGTRRPQHVLTRSCS